MKNLFIVIPVLNGWEYTNHCLEFIEKSNFKNFTVIVVDHGSTDETATALPRYYPNVTHLQGDSTLWWAGATNLGIRYAIAHGATWIMLLNNDCYVTPETLDILMTHVQETGESIIAPLQRSMVNQQLLANRATTCFLLGFPTIQRTWPYRHRLGEHRLVSTQLILGGRGVIIPTSVFNTVGLLDEQSLPHYGADHDFYLRCGSHKIPLYIAADAVVSIDNSKTTLADNPGHLELRGFIETLRSRRSHRNLRDLSTLFRKHYPIKPLYLIGVALNIMRYILKYLYARGRFLLHHQQIP